MSGKIELKPNFILSIDKYMKLFIEKYLNILPIQIDLQFKINTVSYTSERACLSGYSEEESFTIVFNIKDSKTKDFIDKFFKLSSASLVNVHTLGVGKKSQKEIVCYVDKIEFMFPEEMLSVFESKELSCGSLIYLPLSENKALKNFLGRI